MISDDPDFRKKIKSIYYREGIIETAATKEDEKSPYEIQAELESEAIENYDNGSEVYINGKKNNDIDINGINLDKYNIKIKEGKIYLIDK